MESMQLFVFLTLTAFAAIPGFRRAYAIIRRGLQLSLAWYEIDGLDQQGRDAADGLCARAARLSFWIGVSGLIVVAGYVFHALVAHVQSAPPPLAFSLALVAASAAFTAIAVRFEAASSACQVEFEALTGLDATERASVIDDRKLAA